MLRPKRNLYYSLGLQRCFLVDESILSTVGSVYYSMVMYSCDSLKSIMDQVVPLVFLAMHERPKGDSGELKYMVETFLYIRMCIQCVLYSTQHMYFK